MATHVTPALPAAFSSIDGLGAPVAFFRASRPARLFPLVGAMVCSLGAALALVYGLAVTATGYTRHGWAVVEGLARAPVLVFALCILGGLVFGAYTVMMWRRAAAVYEGGIAFRELAGLRAWPWADQAALYAAIVWEVGLPRRNRHRFTVQHISGDRASFDDRLERITELGTLLGRRMVERHYPHAAARFNAGEPVTLGQVSIDQNAIRVNDRLLAWGEVDCVTVRRGYLEVHGKDDTRSGLPVASIPNLDVLLLLLDHVTDLRLEE